MHNLIMNPATGERLLRFVGDQISFHLRAADGKPFPPGWQARLRTNLGRGERFRREIIHEHSGRLRLTGAAWRDIPMQAEADGWSFSIALTQVGFFKAKAYAIDERGRQHWPVGPDAGVSVHPDAYRTANTIYCAFPRMFGESKSETTTYDEKLEHLLKSLDADGYTVIPPSGKLRDLIRELPHIIDRLGCRILHLLPVNPTPTTYARFGRFGSPYACQDLLAIDPALVEFDKRTTAVDQFRELTYETHARGGRVFLDLVINHTGWGSTLQSKHPEWFVRDDQGAFVSPGAWGVVWEDLAELHHRNPALWEHLGDVFLEWCRRGVDGFRCDAGYKIPVPAWRYITARVLQEFPETIFLLEGLGGSWEATEKLLTEGGMQWAYSELFQNYSPQQISSYLDYSLTQSRRVGLYVHYSETHDNDRLAKQGRAWSLLRNRLCALTSVSGGFGFTCGVEWLASEKLQVHHSRGLAWGNVDNLVPELERLNRLLAEHPCFFDNATLCRLSTPDSPVQALGRTSAEGKDRVLILINSDVKRPQTLQLEADVFAAWGNPGLDLLGQEPPVIQIRGGEKVEFHLPAGGSLCLSSKAKPVGLTGEGYRRARAQAAWGITAISRKFAVRDISSYDWRRLAALVERSARRFLSAVTYLDPEAVKGDVVAALEATLGKNRFPPVVTWHLGSRMRVTVVPSDHWLLVEDETPFRVVLQAADGKTRYVQSIAVPGQQVAFFPPGQPPGDAEMVLERYAPSNRSVRAPLRFLPQDGVQEGTAESFNPALLPAAVTDPDAVVLLTNGLGGMARLAVDLGRVRSKYDCVLGANLHPRVPVDRHIFVKRVRVWVNADGFITPLHAENLVEFSAGPPASWRFVASAGDARAVEIQLCTDMLSGRNATVLRFDRPAASLPFGRELPSEALVSLTVRVDIEDRNFHTETHHNGGADHHFAVNCRALTGQIGFEFYPAPDRHLRMVSDRGIYHHEGEWSHGLAHPIEATRGQIAHGDAYSPGWFELPIAKGQSIVLCAYADGVPPSGEELARFAENRRAVNRESIRLAEVREKDDWGQQLAQAVQAFVVRRDESKTVIAGYPWFLDWGRDSLICARGMLAAGLIDEVKGLLTVFGRFEKHGTLPNTIHGEDASNRDTSDAPLWYGLVCEETAAMLERRGDKAQSVYAMTVDAQGRTVLEVLKSIASGYSRGTPNGIRLDPASGLIWSPSHFTWMDTNYPAATPREGYPVETQALWIRLLRQLARLVPENGEDWETMAGRAEQSLLKFYWMEERGHLSDLLIAKPGQAANQAAVDNALRSNGLFAITLGLLQGERAQRCVEAALRYLVVPGALRSLAPVPVSPPLAIHGHDGQLLNSPSEPYWGRYEGDEDTRRKPAYHNGTAWTWTFPTCCEALARAWNFDSAAVEAAKAYLGSMRHLLNTGCLGHLPEILDGDAPHTQRGCDAQAWSVTEALRVWKLLQEAR